MSELRLVVVASVSGDAESVVEEALFEYDDDEAGALSAAGRAAAWLHKLAADLAGEASS
jgi:hypothetical protein